MDRRSKAPTKEARFKAILDAATEVLVEKPTASMNEIAEYAGVGVATLHRYVENREKLMVYLGYRAIQAVSETIEGIPLNEENDENYISKLVEALIPLGDKVYFLGHDASVYYNKELEEADEKLRAPVRCVIQRLQKKGFFIQSVNSEWILNVLYSLLFLTWQQVQEGHIAKNSAASLVLSTFYHGFRAK
ncbi:TetR/AcrR family transcriptional regulator [Halalkalibacterium halodurans]|uniref:TetR/AcrR family transcriptional regulator n=1 Tax=Halalkalibacterium halodurans TaxID=86665 RepID=UPI001FB95DA9|nr:TetR/AcrR family transcriptional regulator [Halalkalibacterium halodurans]